MGEGEAAARPSARIVHGRWPFASWRLSTNPQGTIPQSDESSSRSTFRTAVLAVVALDSRRNRLTRSL